jgi:membrane protein implicated in regulation of membrane protease activity
MHQRRLLVLGVGIFVLLVVSLQIFLLMVGLEAWLTYNTGVAWGAAGTSVLLATFVILLYRFLMRGPRTVHTTSRRPRPGVRTDRTMRPTSTADRPAQQARTGARSAAREAHGAEPT